MKTKNLFRVLPAVAAVLLFAACSGDDQNVAPVTEPETPAGKGTVIHYSATVSDGTTTRATLNSSKQYEFQTGDKLAIVSADGKLTGDLTLTSGADEATATFEGDLNYTGEGTPADNLVLQAVLVSSSNAMTTLTYASAEYPETAIASTLAEAIEKYSHFKATSTYGAKLFTMDQQTSFLNFTVTLTDGTTAGTDLDITITNGGSTVRTGTVTTATVSENVVAQFVAAMPAGTTMSSATFQLGSKSAVSFGGTTELVANKIYNISKTIAASSSLTGQFSVSTTKKVCFSKGNLRATYDGSSWTWAFAENQWDYIGDATTTPTGNGNTSINGNGTVSASNVTVDLFGWVGASSTWTGAAQYGISNSTATNNTNGYGNNASEALKSDWGNTISDDYTWFTLSSVEWTYLFNTRTTTSGVRYAKAKVNGKSGVILLPDDWSTSYYSLSSTNTASAAYTTNSITSTDWTNSLEAHGAVFLPAAGYRDGTSVDSAGSYGLYWSSSPNGTSRAYRVYFNSGNLNPAYDGSRRGGLSVRLVRQVE